MLHEVPETSKEKTLVQDPGKVFYTERTQGLTAAHMVIHRSFQPAPTPNIQMSSTDVPPSRAGVALLVECTQTAKGVLPRYPCATNG